MRVWGAFALLALVACGGREAEVPAGRDYLQEVQQVLQELRVLDRQIAAQVIADTLDSGSIVPLIRQQYRPTLALLRQRVAALAPDSAFSEVNQQLLGYLDLRLRAYDLAIQGEQEQRQELFEEFARLQVQADAEGRALEEGLRQARHRR
jgi:hypothetical protein